MSSYHCRFTDKDRGRELVFYDVVDRMLTAVQWLYDDEGRVTEKVLLEVGGPIPAMSVEKGQWHRLECLESGTVIVEFKDGPYEPISPEDVME